MTYQNKFEIIEKDQKEVSIGVRTYRVTDTGKPLKNVSDEPTSPVYEGGIILETKVEDSWAFIERFESEDELEDFFRLAKRQADQKSPFK